MQYTKSKLYDQPHNTNFDKQVDRGLARLEREDTMRFSTLLNKMRKETNGRVLRMIDGDEWATERIQGTYWLGLHYLSETVTYITRNRKEVP